MSTLLFMAMAPCYGAEQELPEKIDFNRDIRPIFSNACYTCHGPDIGNRQAELRLDMRESVLGSLESGEIGIVPGSHAKSELYLRIVSEDEDDLMPPVDSNLPPLSEYQKKLIKKWIDEGAEYKTHWAFVKPVRPTVPRTTLVNKENLTIGLNIENGKAEKSEIEKAQTPIDHFVRAKLLRSHLNASPVADKVTLIRRVTQDLTGLPPTSAEIDTFVNDTTYNAYEQLVDRLLDSPAYGEHMAHYWLDAVRYADTHGLHFDNYRQIWPYRDWVIKAFNKNLSFDQFTRDQLAGDLVENPTQDQLIATGYIRSNITSNEGGSFEAELLARYTTDRVEVTSTVWLGLTAGCASCHDHRYDPLTQKEFYQMYAFFNNTAEPIMDKNSKLWGTTLKVYSPEQKKKNQQFLAELAVAIAGQQKLEPEVNKLQAVWEADLIQKIGSKEITEHPLTLGPWYEAAPFIGKSYEAAFEQSFGPEKTTDGAVDLKAKFEKGKIAWKNKNKKKAYVDGKVNALSIKENGVTYLYRTLTAKTPHQIELSLGSDDGIIVWHNGKQVLANKTTRGVQPDQELLLLNLVAGQNHLLLKIVNGGGDHGFYFSKKEPLVAGITHSLATLLKIEVTKRNEKQKKTIQDYFRDKYSEAWKKIVQDVAGIKKHQAAFNAKIPGTLIAKELATPRKTHLLYRGEYDKPRDEVQRGVPAWLHSFPKGAPRNRLGYAEWIVSRENPLMARVVMNRFWQQIFGVGLVATSENFGIQTEWPSHPALLDWLAVEFIESDWDVKHMMKLMVTSATYRQVSHADPLLYKLDPENRYLARGSRYRMDAEQIRDQALWVSGLLSPKIGGPSVKPYQPLGLWKAVGYSSSNTANFKQDKGEALYRRSLYTFWKRTSSPPTLAVMDAPLRDTCTVRRPRTNTPLAALALMNDIQYVEAARHLAQRTLLENKEESSVERLRFMFRLTTSRLPKPNEEAVLVKQLELHLTRYKESPEEAKKLLSIGESPREKSLEVSEHAAWTMVANLILNLDETLSKN